jgi:peptidoglycan biosynthesis protein MviN/MurJ (putative lipid II flippase)
LTGFSLISKNGEKEMLRLGLVALTVNIVGNLIFVPKFGVWGAVVVTIITEMIGVILGAYKLARK